MTARHDLRRLNDEGLRTLMGLVVSAYQEVECEKCHTSVRCEDTALQTTLCPNCGESLAGAISSFSTAELPTRVGGGRLTHGRREFSLPQRIGRYEIRGELGRGAFGRVLRAYDPETKREVALKIPRLERFGDDVDSQHAKRKYVNKFLAEGRRTASLRHPGIVEVLEVGEEAETGWAYIAMELIEGETLHQRMRREPSLSRAEVARMIAEAAEAVHYAHNQRIYHCDLKPTNILLTPSGQAKVTDFGLAVHEDEQMLEEGQYAGTLPYMSPEQIEGHRHFLDGRTDVWSLGVMLYELLAGRRPFGVGGDDRQTRNAILHKDFTPLAQRTAQLPAAYDRIVAKCLEKRMADRYESSEKLARDLRSARRGEQFPWRYLRGRPAAIVASVALGLFLATAATAFFLPSRSALSVVPAPGEFVIDSVATSGAPLSLLHHPLREYLVRKEALPSWHQDHSAGWVTMKGRYLDVLELGSIRAPSYRLTLEMKSTDWVGLAGICLGIASPDEDGRASAAPFQAIWLQGDHTAPCRLERAILHPLFDKPQTSILDVSRTRFVDVAIDRPDVHDTCRLEIDVQDGIVQAVRWNGQLLPGLVEPQNAAAREVPRATGGIGLINFRGATDYTRCTLQLR